MWYWCYPNDQVLKTTHPIQPQHAREPSNHHGILFFFFSFNSCPFETTTGLQFILFYFFKHMIDKRAEYWGNQVRESLPKRNFQKIIILPSIMPLIGRLSSRGLLDNDNYYYFQPLIRNCNSGGVFLFLGLGDPTTPPVIKRPSPGALFCNEQGSIGVGLVCVCVWQYSE